MSSGLSELFDFDDVEEIEDDIMGTRNGAKLTYVCVC